MSQTPEQIAEERFFKKVSKSPTCWLWDGFKNEQGYGRLSVNGKQVAAHRFSWQCHFGEIPKGFWVLHHCDNPPCVRPDHLFLGNVQINVRDMMRKGRFVSNHKQAFKSPKRIANLPRGENSKKSKMTTAKVMEARLMFETGNYDCAELGKMFGMSQRGMYKIVHRKNWRHV